MSSVLMLCTPVRGHVSPLLAVASALVAAGDRVRFMTGARYRDEVVAAGAEYLPLPAEADYDDRDMDAAFPGRVGLSGPKGIRHDMIEIFLRPAPAQLAAVRAALAAEHTDAILSEPMFAASALIAELPRHERPLLVDLGIIPLGLRHPDVAPFGLGVKPLPGAIGRLRNAVLTALAEKGVFAPVQKYADEMARRELGRGLSGFFLNWPAGADLLIQFTVPEFEYDRTGLPDTVRFVGPVTRARPTTAALPEWWDELHSGLPVVHVTQGTVANQGWSLVEPTVRALADQRVLVVASTGGRPLDSLPTDLPTNVRAATFLPYDRLLPLTDVYITNGGYGGVHFALEHGVPIVAAGRTEDKTEVSARIDWSGVGVDLRTDDPTPSQIRRAVRRVLDDPSFRERSEQIGVAIRRSPGPDAVHGLIAEALATRNTHAGGAR